MSQADRINQQRLLREAEGYFDLITVFNDRWSLPPELRDVIAARALDCLQECECSPSEQARRYYLRGLVYREIGRFADAVHPLQQASVLDPTNLYIYFALGWCYKRIGRIDLAIESLENGLEVESDCALLHYNLACYWALANRPKVAVNYLATAFELDSVYRDLVDTETDFDPIRSHPDFLALTSIIV